MKVTTTAEPRQCCSGNGAAVLIGQAPCRGRHRRVASGADKRGRREWPRGSSSGAVPVFSSAASQASFAPTISCAVTRSPGALPSSSAAVPHLERHRHAGHEALDVAVLDQDLVARRDGWRGSAPAARTAELSAARAACRHSTSTAMRRPTPRRASGRSTAHDIVLDSSMGPRSSRRGRPLRWQRFCYILRRSHARMLRVSEPYASPKAHGCERSSGVTSLARRRGSGSDREQRARGSRQRWAADCTWATFPTSARTRI